MKKRLPNGEEISYWVGRLFAVRGAGKAHQTAYGAPKFLRIVTMDLRQRATPAPAAQQVAPMSLADIVASMPPPDAPQPSDIGLLEILRLIGVQMGVQDQPPPRLPVVTLGVRG